MVFQDTQTSGLALLTLRITDDITSEAIETAAREQTSRFLIEWKGDIKWDYFINFQRDVK